MQAVLQESYVGKREAAEDASAVVLLDFMKAYDTLNREFMLLALQRFGFDARFVQLVGRMHERTTAHSRSMANFLAQYQSDPASDRGALSRHSCLSLRQRH